MVSSEGLDKALLCTSIGAAAGAVVGTSTVTSYIESAAAAADGGRTGLYSRCNRSLYLVALFFAPLVLIGTTTSDSTGTYHNWRIYDE